MFGVGPLGSILFIILLILRINDVIDWSWWIVTMPLWIGWVLFGLLIIINNIRNGA